MRLPAFVPIVACAVSKSTLTASTPGADLRAFSALGTHVCHVMPSMLTQDRRVIQQDCLCYLMERIHFEDNEEVTGIDPLPESIERSDTPRGSGSA